GNDQQHPVLPEDAIRNDENKQNTDHPAKAGDCLLICTVTDMGQANEVAELCPISSCHNEWR
ncbi:MAG: hypothetical protein ABTQ25_00745, partial [Nitrosomonas ureae]